MSKLATQKETVIFTKDRVSKSCLFYMNDQLQYDPLKRAFGPQNSLQYLARYIYIIQFNSLFANTYRNSLLDMRYKTKIILNVNKDKWLGEQCQGLLRGYKHKTAIFECSVALHVAYINPANVTTASMYVR